MACTVCRLPPAPSLARQAEAAALVLCVPVQPVCQQHELRAFCTERGIAWMAHTPFGGKGAPLLRDGRLQPACRRLGASPAQVVLGWCQHHGAIAIPKTQSEVRMRENAFPCQLDAAAVAAVDSMDPPPPDFDVSPAPLPETSEARARDDVLPVATIATTTTAATATPEVLTSAKALLDVVTAIVQEEGQDPRSDRLSGRGCAWFGGVSPTELIDFTRSELVEVEQELVTLRKLKVEAVGQLVATVSWPGGPCGPSWKEEQDEQEACCGRLEGELGDVLFDALLLVRKCEVATSGQVSLAGAFAAAAQKVRRRCPHVFAGERAPTRADAEAIWQREKARERQRTGIRVEVEAEPEALWNAQSTKLPVEETECSSDEEDEEAQSSASSTKQTRARKESIFDLSSAAAALGSSMQQLLTLSESALDEMLEEKLSVKRSTRKNICDERKRRQRDQKHEPADSGHGPKTVKSAAVHAQAEPTVADDASASELKEQGTRAFKAKNYVQAAAFYGEAANRDPDDATHSANQCFSLLRANQPAAAVEAGREAVRRKPSWAKAHYRLGSALAALGTEMQLQLGNNVDASAALDVLRAAQDSLTQCCELDPESSPMAAALRDVRKTIDATLSLSQRSTSQTQPVSDGKDTMLDNADKPHTNVPISPADIGRDIPKQKDGSSERTAVPKPKPVIGSRGRQAADLRAIEQVQKAETPELPEAKVNPLGSLVDDLPVSKGPDNPADAVNAALDKARAFDKPTPAADPVAPAADTDTEAGDVEGVYKRWPISCVVVEGKGKALKAARPILAGAVVYQARPWISVVADGFMRSVCAHCFKSTADETQGGAEAAPPPDLPFACPGCAACGYCSVECKDAAAFTHSKECDSVAQIVRMTAGKSDSRGPRMIIRALAQRAADLDGGDSEAEKKRQLNLPTFVDVCKLVDHMNDLPRHKQKEFLSIAAGVGSLPIGKHVGRAELVRLVAILRCNSQAVVDLDKKRKGDVLIAPADFNHSCAPNCTVVFYGNTIQVRTMREIEPDEELTIQYTDLYLPRGERQERLRNSHCFSCACARCIEGTGRQQQTVDRRVEGFRCGMNSCDGLVPPPLAGEIDGGIGCWVCVKCGQSHAHRAKSLQQSAAAAKVLYATAVETQRRGDFEAARSLLEDLISRHSGALFWQHAILYNAHHSLFSACNALEDTEDAASAASKALACLRAVYPPYHPVRLLTSSPCFMCSVQMVHCLHSDLTHCVCLSLGGGLVDKRPRAHGVASLPSFKWRRWRAAGEGNCLLSTVLSYPQNLCWRGPPSGAKSSAGARFRHQECGLMHFKRMSI